MTRVDPSRFLGWILIMYKTQTLPVVRTMERKKFLVSGSFDGTVKVWQASSGECVRRIRGHSGAVVCVKAFPKGDHVATGSWDKTIRIFNVSSGECVSVMRKHTPSSLCIYPHGDRLASAGDDGNVLVWSASGALLQTLADGHTGNVSSVVLTTDEQLVSGGSSDKSLCVWEDGKTSAKLTRESPVSCCAAFNVDRAVAFGSTDGTLAVYHIVSKKISFEIDCSSAVNDVCVTPDDANVVSAHDDRSLKLWDVASESLIFSFENHIDAVYCVCATPSGKKIFSGSRDKSIRVFDLRQKQAQAVWPGAHSSTITSLDILEADVSIVHDISTNNRKKDCTVQ